MDEKKLIKDLFLAYYECRKNKRNTINAKKFEFNYEHNLFELKNEILNRTYTPEKSITFIIEKPVKREIFAADFKDRIIHHYIIKKLNNLFETRFIYDSYACRKNKGTLFGVKRIYNFIKKCSNNYKNDCFILKMDIEGFFMTIDKKILKKSLFEFVEEKYHSYDKDIILFLIEKILENDPTINCTVKGKKEKWFDLPKTKSLFHSAENCGLPIGNLTSQIFANFYLNKFDHFVINELKIPYYGRYVDDFIIIHNDKNYLLNIIPKIKIFLKNELNLKLHPKKIYLQHYKKGVNFLGSHIKPDRIYAKNNVKGNFFQKIKNFNKFLHKQNIEIFELKHIMSVVNSYLGTFAHFNTYKIRQKMLLSINNMNNFFRIKKNKIIINKKYERNSNWNSNMVQPKFKSYNI